MPAEISIALPSLCMRFGEGEEYDLADLHRQLQAQSITAPVPIKRPGDAMMRADGTVNKGYHFTPSGLSSVCQKLVPGLSQVISSIGGVREGNLDSVRSDPDTDLAITTYNECVQYAFERIAGHRFIIDPGRQAIEGLVGPKYVFLSNQDWLLQCQTFIDRTAYREAEFLGASLTGRRFLLRFVSRGEWFHTSVEDGTREVYRKGWSFSNSETGKSAVRVGFMIVDSTGAGSLCQLAKQDHTSSLRKDKGEKLLTKLRETFECVDAAALRNYVQGMHRQLIPVSDTVMGNRDLAHRIATNLSKRLPKSLARSVVASTLSTASRQLVPAGVGVNMRFNDIVHVPTERTYYHFYHALTTRARQCFPDEQERAEALAYDLLRRRFTPVSPSKT
jgi:hypothetical protein